MVSSNPIDSSTSNCQVSNQVTWVHSTQDRHMHLSTPHNGSRNTPHYCFCTHCWWLHHRPQPPIDDFIANLSKHFKVKDKGLLKVALNIKIGRNHTTRSIYLPQEDVLEEINQDNGVQNWLAAPLDTQLSKKHHFYAFPSKETSTS